MSEVLSNGELRRNHARQGPARYNFGCRWPHLVGGEVVDSNLEGQAEALRALGKWQRHRAAELEQTFFTADLDTALAKYRGEDDETYRRRRAAASALARCAAADPDSAALDRPRRPTGPRRRARPARPRQLERAALDRQALPAGRARPPAPRQPERAAQ